jgi:hypothetical protein
MRSFMSVFHDCLGCADRILDALTYQAVFTFVAWVLSITCE